jgi:hypothetical protein
LIQRFSFELSTVNDQTYGKSVRIYVGGLFVNQKHMDVGSTLLTILKSALKTLVNLGQFSYGAIELYSVETAVLFYIKNGFIVRDLYIKNDPQYKVESTHKMIHFALKEQNIEIMRMYAQVTTENFMEFIQYLLEKTKYGQYFRAYFEALETPDEKEKNILQSRFISSLFSTSMVYPYVRDMSQQKITLKPMTT